MSKVIFLDIDGVIWTPRKCHSLRSMGSNKEGLDEVAANLVLRLVENTDAKIVVSSTWRLGCKDLEEFLKDFYRLGFLHDHFEEDWRTKSIGSMIRERGDEVNEWLSRHPEVTKWVCLDDDSDFYPENNLVQTDAYEGFGLRHYIKAEKILGKIDNPPQRVQ